jgi:hypothetical protein
LRRMAHQHLRRERIGHTIQPRPTDQTPARRTRWLPCPPFLELAAPLHSHT